MKSAILLSMLTLGAAAGAMSFGTFAFFSDAETSTGNVFAAADLDLTVGGTNGVTASFRGDNFAPGDSAAGSLVLRNEGSLYTTSEASTMAHAIDLDIGATTNVVDDPGSPADPDDGGVSGAAFARYLVLTQLRYDRQDLLLALPDVDGDGRKTLADLGAAPAFRDLADPGAGGRTFLMAVRFDESGPNHLKRDVASVDFAFFLGQTGEVDLAS